MECTHRTYATLAEAETALTRIKARAKRSGKGGTSWKRLNVFPCGNHFHIGRANKLPKNYSKPQPVEKIPSMGDLRRQLKRIEKKMDAENKHQAFLIGQRIESDLRMIDAERELIEVQRQARAVFGLA